MKSIRTMRYVKTTMPTIPDTSNGVLYPRMQLLTVGEIIDGARFKTPGAVGRVDQAALPLT